MNVEVIRTDGKREQHQIAQSGAIRSICKLIDCDTVDSVNLRDGRVMLVDDNGYDLAGHREHRDTSGALVLDIVPGAPRKPFNPEATKLYHGVCRPGTTHQIVGDVAIVLDEDFA